MTSPLTQKLIAPGATTSTYTGTFTITLIPFGAAQITFENSNVYYWSFAGGDDAGDGPYTGTAILNATLEELAGTVATFDAGYNIVNLYDSSNTQIGTLTLDPSVSLPPSQSSPSYWDGFYTSSMEDPAKVAPRPTPE